MYKYDNDMMLLFMCGIPEEWEQTIIDTRPDVSVKWLGRHIANVKSNNLIINIEHEIIEKHYAPIEEIFPCISYCRSALITSELVSNEYEKDMILFFMCGLQKEWEQMIIDTRPDVNVNWLGSHVANLRSDNSIINIQQEIREKHFIPVKDIFPCISYCRSELLYIDSKNKKYKCIFSLLPVINDIYKDAKAQEKYPQYYCVEDKCKLWVKDKQCCDLLEKDPINNSKSEKILNEFPRAGKIVLAIVKTPGIDDKVAINVEKLYNSRGKWYKDLTNHPLEENSEVTAWKYRNDVINFIKDTKYTKDLPEKGRMVVAILETPINGEIIQYVQMMFHDGLCWRIKNPHNMQISKDIKDILNSDTKVIDWQYQENIINFFKNNNLKEV